MRTYVSPICAGYATGRNLRSFVAVENNRSYIVIALIPYLSLHARDISKLTSKICVVRIATLPIYCATPGQLPTFSILLVVVQCWRVRRAMLGGTEEIQHTANAPDWTNDIPESDFLTFFLSVDWSRTPLGALKDWSIALRLYTFQVLADSRPAVVYW